MKSYSKRVLKETAARNRCIKLEKSVFDNYIVSYRKQFFGMTVNGENYVYFTLDEAENKYDELSKSVLNY